MTFSEQVISIPLVYAVEYDNISDAIAREKQLKNWHKEWKWNLVKESVSLNRGENITIDDSIVLMLTKNLIP